MKFTPRCAHFSSFWKNLTSHRYFVALFRQPAVGLVPSHSLSGCDLNFFKKRTCNHNMLISFLFLSSLMIAEPAISFAEEQVHSSPLSSEMQEVFFPKGPFIASRGSRGDRGHRGHRGKKGGRGRKGLVGDRGYRGPLGCYGHRGAIGATGAQGPQGDSATVAGPTGPTGPIGLGQRGAIGPTGPSSVSLDPARPFVWDEFISGSTTTTTIGALGWTLQSGILSLPPLRHGLKNHPGVLPLPIGTLLGLSPSLIGSIYLPDPIDVRMVVRVTTDIETSFGFFSPGTCEKLVFVAAPSSNRDCVQDCIMNTWHIRAIRSGSLPFDYDTEIPVTHDWVSLRICRAIPCGNAFFYINGELICTVSASSIPDGPVDFRIGSEGYCPDIPGVDVDYVSFRWLQLNR